MAPKLTAAIVLVTMLSAGAAAAGPNEQRLAQALFDEGRRLMDQKRYAEACPKLAESQRLDPGGGTLLNLAVCHAGEGRTATALVEYNEALSVAMRDGRQDRVALARAAIDQLEREVPRVTVRVPAGARVPGLEVKIDGAVLPSVAWDVPMPVDPGSHTVVATMPGQAPWMAILSVLPEERKAVDVMPLRREPAPQLPAANGAPPIVVEAPAPASPSAEPTPAASRWNPAYTVIIAGTVAAAGASVVTGILAVSERAKATDGCIVDRNFCRTAEAQDAATNSTTLAWVSTGALFVTVLGGVLLLTVPSRRIVRSGRGTFALEATF